MCPSPPSAGVGDHSTRQHKAGRGLGPTVCSQFRSPSWSLMSPRAMSSTGQSCKSWGRTEPEKDTQPCLALPRLSLGMGALGTVKWRDPGVHGGWLERSWGFQEEERLHESIAQSRTSLETLSIWADIALGKKEEASPRLMGDMEMCFSLIPRYWVDAAAPGSAPSPGTSDATESCTTSFQTHCSFIFLTYQIRKKSVQDTCQ